VPAIERVEISAYEVSTVAPESDGTAEWSKTTLVVAERDKYDISMAIGEATLLPAVRETPAATLLVADGFSCREQVEQATGRKGLHLAQVAEMALRQAGSLLESVPRGDRPRIPRIAVAAAAAVVLAGIAWARAA
jgi:hypothetical protein